MYTNTHTCTVSSTTILMEYHTQKGQWHTLHCSSSSAVTQHITNSKQEYWGEEVLLTNSYPIVFANMTITTITIQQYTPTTAHIHRMYWVLHEQAMLLACRILQSNELVGQEMTGEMWWFLPHPEQQHWLTVWNVCNEHKSVMREMRSWEPLHGGGKVGEGGGKEGEGEGRGGWR